jgi:CpXC protein
MSIFHPAMAVCKACGTKTAVERSASVNADRRPDLRTAIIDGSFQATDCGKCGTRLRLPPHLTYLDMRRGWWIMAEPAPLIEEWPRVEAEARQTYDATFGDRAPPSGRMLGDGLRSRLVFGWPALREKLICADLELDDLSLELLKMAVMRHVDNAPISDETELRLVGGEKKSLAFAWVVAATEERLAELAVPRDIYDGVAGDTEAWEAVRAKFEGQLLVDLRRLTTGPAVPAAAE